MKGKVRFPGAVVAGATAIAIAAGCGSTGSDAGGGTSGGDGASKKTIKIGFDSILSGPAATAGTGTDAGAKAYLQMVNEKGGVNGYKFTFVEQDNQYDPARAAAVARKLIDDGAFLLIQEGSATAEAIAPIAKAANVPLITESDGGLLTPPDKVYEGAYGINPDYGRIAAQGADFILNELDQKKAGFVYLNTATGEPAKEAFPAYMKANGGEVTTTEAIDLTTNDYSPFAAKLKRSGADVVYAFILDAQLPALQKAADAIGYHPTWVTWFDPYTPSYLKLAGELSEGVYVTQFVAPLQDTSDPDVKQYLATMKKYAPSQIKNQPAEQGWTFGAIIERAVKEATDGGKELTPEGFTQALQDIRGESLGLVPSVTYNAETHAGATKAAYYKIQNGKLKQQTPYEELPEAPAGE